MDETKICPFCGETINSQAQKCKYCGEWLNNNICKNNFVSKKFLKIIVCIFISITVIALSYLVYNLYKNRYNVEEITYKSISNIEESAESLAPKYSARELLNKIIKQEEDLSEYMQGKHSTKEKTGVFQLYYKNLKLLTKMLDKTNYKVGDIEFERDQDSTYTRFGVPVPKGQVYIVPYVKIINPNTNILELLLKYKNLDYTDIDEIEFDTEIQINDSYIANTYAKYLNKSWNDYINNKKRIYGDLRHQCYFEAGYINPDSLTLAKWVMMWEEFLKQYPNFELQNEITKDIEKYSKDILYRKVYNYYNGKIKIQEGCEYFLKHANKNTDIYRQIKKDYEILKNNNFEYHEDTNNI